MARNEKVFMKKGAFRTRQPELLLKIKKKYWGSLKCEANCIFLHIRFFFNFGEKLFFMKGITFKYLYQISLNEILENLTV